MRRVVVFEHLTLDGVMQAPGRADEDRRDGFAHGGWATLWDRYQPASRRAGPRPSCGISMRRRLRAVS